MSTAVPQFLFMTCRAGAEAALKQEIARSEPTWRPAFSRPGFLTFKLAEKPADSRQLAERQWTFAHAQGISLERFTGGELSQLADQVWQLEGIKHLLDSGTIADIHVWELPPAGGEEQPAEVAATPLAREIEAAIRAAAPETWAKRRRPTTGRRRPAPRGGVVLDVVVIQPGEWCVGYHTAVTVPQRWPGGAVPIPIPPHAVSRAYVKMEEALQWSRLPLASGDECVEIGCAPGGASQALLDRGLFVTGIDPADVEPALREHPRFRHLKKRGRDVRRHEFLGVRWLAADMNIPPQATLDEVEAIVTHPQVSIRGLVLTLKLADWSHAERLSEYLSRVRSWGYRDVRARQLLSGGQEVCLVALRRKALRRLAGARRRKRKTPGKRLDAPHTEPRGPHF